MRSFRICILAAVLMTAFAVNADAVPITFTHASAMSGHIGTTYFTNAPFVITAVGDTDDITIWPESNLRFIVHDSASIDITGVGHLTISIPTRTHVNYKFGAVGFSQPAAEDLCDGPIFVSELYTWDMLSSIGPLSGAGGMNPWNPVPTSGGDLYMDGGSCPVVTFTATVASAPVPEPASMLLFGSGLLAWAGLRRRFRK
jgi:hypothetical protein